MREYCALGTQLARASDPHKLAEEVETLLLQSDMQFFVDLAHNPHLSRVLGSAVQCLYPFLAAFVRDSSLYVQKRYSRTDQVIEDYRDLIIQARLSIKPLEVDNRISGQLKTLDEVEREIDRLIEFSDSKWIGDYPYLLRVIREMRQPTVGASFIGSELISTTHTALLGLGFNREKLEQLYLDPTDMSEFVFEMGRSIGEFTVELALALRIPLNLEVEYEERDPPSVMYNDYFSRKLYPTLTETVSRRRAVCVLLMAVVAQVNFVRLLLPYLSTSNKLPTFKMRFLALFEATKTLDKLMQNHSQQQVMTAFASEQIRKANASPELRTLKKCEALRNALFHYEVKEKWRDKLSSGLPLNGLIEAHARGASIEEVDRNVCEGLDHIACHLKILFSGDMAPKFAFD